MTRAIQAQYPNLMGLDHYVADLLATYRRLRDGSCDCEDCQGTMEEYRRRISQCVRLRHFNDPTAELVFDVIDLGLTMN